MSHKHDYEYSTYCGGSVCYVCDHHAHVRVVFGGDHGKDGTVSQELARCYCGWKLAPGERLDDDVEE